MKRKTKDLFIFSFLFLGIGIIIYLLFSQGSMCLKEPLVYGANLRSDKEANFNCVCDYNVPNSPTTLFNSTNIWELRMDYTVEFNITKSFTNSST